MKKNVGNLDRNIRIILGVLLLAAGTLMQLGTGWRIGLIAVAAVAFATAFTGFCFLWSVLGINTLEHKEEKAAGPQEKLEETPEEKGKPEGQ